MRQYLTLVDDTEEEEAEESIDRLFSCLDESSSSESDSESDHKKKPKAAQGKKEKAKKVKKVQKGLAW